MTKKELTKSAWKAEKKRVILEAKDHAKRAAREVWEGAIALLVLIAIPAYHGFLYVKAKHDVRSSVAAVMSNTKGK